MKENEFLDGVSNIESDVVERFVLMDNKLQNNTNKSKSKGLWLRIGAVAACLALILGAMIVVPMLRDGGSDVTIGMPNIPTVNVQIPSPAPQYYGSNITPFVQGSSSADIITDGISVTAKIVSISPDTYTFYDDWQQKPYRIIEFKVLRLLDGKNMMGSFYFLIPERYMTDFSKYDRFVIKDMGMFGYDHSILYNQTDGCAEQFYKVIFGSLCTDPNYIIGENFKAFNKDGYLDVSLWNANDAWKRATQWIFDYTNPYDSDYTLKQAEEDAKDGFDGREVVLLNTLTGDAATALEYAKNFENG